MATVPQKDTTRKPSSQRRKASLGGGTNLAIFHCGFRYFKKLLKDQNAKIDDLQKTQAVLQTKGDAKVPRTNMSVASMVCTKQKDKQAEHTY
jgi:hypothetical protein